MVNWDKNSIGQSYGEQMTFFTDISLQLKTKKIISFSSILSVVFSFAGEN